MASVCLLVVVLSAFCTCYVACYAFHIEQRPDLAPYQDISKCAARGATWYVLYRNEKKGAFAADDSCLSDTQMSHVIGGKGLFRFRYAHGQERNATLTFKSDDGRHYNSIEVQPEGASGMAPYNMLFVDCDHCRIFKSPHSPKCFISVREASLRHGVPQHCHFLYDLLCGTRSKHQVSDSSCFDDREKMG